MNVAPPNFPAPAMVSVSAMSALRFVFCLLVAIAALAMPLLSHAQTPAGRLEGIDRNIFLLNAPTSLNITIKNTGPAMYFRLVPTQVPGGWQLEQDNNRVFVNAGANHTFTRGLIPGPERTGSLGFQLVGFQDWNINFPVVVNSASYSVIAKPAPGPFDLLGPTNGQVNVPFSGECFWQIASEAVWYNFYLYEDIGSGPASQPLAEIRSMPGRSVRISELPLEPAKSYWWGVVAQNEVAVTPNNGGLSLFTMEPPPPLGPFALTAPAAAAEVPLRPTIQWTASENAFAYAIEVYADNNGAPVVPAIRKVQGLNALSYTFSEAISPGYYHFQVFATRDAQERANNGGPVRVRLTDLRPFTLLEPLGTETPTSRKPRFRWQETQNASTFSFYRVRIYKAGASVPSFTLESPSASLDLQFLPQELDAGTVYDWDVEAVNSLESRFNDGGRGTFRTSGIRPFALIAPQADAVGVPAVPTFEWEALTPPIGYLLTLCPSVNGEPDEGAALFSPALDTNVWTSTFPPLSPGAEYFWKVAAGDGQTLVENIGGYRWFRVSPLTPFRLSRPLDTQLNVSPQPVLEWQLVPGAQRYTIYLFLESTLLLLPPIEVPTNVARYDFAANGKYLNGITDYTWFVVAHADGDLLRSADTFRFTTRRRNTANGIDIVETILLRQLISEDERNALGVFETPATNVVDASAWTRWRVANP